MDTARQSDNPAQTFGAVSRLNHWLFAFLFLAMLGVGLVLAYGGLEHPARSSLMGLHKATGVLMLGFALWRVSWRVWQGFPAPASTMPAWQDRVAKRIHILLLVAAFLMPLSGVLGSILGGRAVDVFGAFTIPAVTNNELLDAVADGSHTATAYVVIACLALHIGAALKHHFVDRDGTLGRMLTGRGR
jgi:cytochrome b561